MKNMTCGQAAEWSCGEWSWAGAGGGEGRAIRGLCFDSREAAAGKLFFALKGEKRDGHEFAAGVVAAGGLAVVRRDWTAPDGLSGEGGVLRVEDPMAALGDVAAGWRRHLSGTTVVGVTGSSGKTSTKELTAQVLETVGPTVRTSGNFNNHIGVPVSVGELDEGTRFGVIEAGVSHPGEMAGLKRVMQPNAAVVSNIGVAHLEAFGSARGIAEEKGILLEGLPEGGFAVIGREGGEYERLREMCGGKAVTCGWGDETGLDYAGTVGEGERAGWMRIRETGSGEEAWVRIPPPGGFMAENALRAAAVGRRLGATWEGIAAAMESGVRVGMRWEIVRLSGGRRAVNDAYNANPASMRAAVAAFAKEAGRKFLALGGMRELGPGALEAHRAVGRDVAGAGRWDGVAVVGSGDEMGPLADALSEGLREGGVPADRLFRAASHEEAARWLDGRMGEGDAVLLKGSRGATMEKVLDWLGKGDG